MFNKRVGVSRPFFYTNTMAEICLKNIVTVRDYCAGEKSNSLSGFDLLDAPEISTQSLAAMANPDYLTGLELARSKVELARKYLETDFLALLAQSGVQANLFAPKISTGGFANTSNNAPAPMERGITIYKNPKQSGLKKLRITEVSIYPMNSGNYTLNFYDSGFLLQIPVTLVANQINTFPVDYVVQGSSVKILLDNTTLGTYTSNLTCLLGCNGGIPNECGYVKGYNGSTDVQREGFGINAVFSCECDFSELLCMFAKQATGKIIWLKARVLLLEERLETTRLNAWIIYGREEASKKMDVLENEYREAWNIFVASLPELLKYTGSDCLNCKGIQSVVNV